MYVNWYIDSENTLQFEVYDRNEGWYDVPGLYIFSCQVANEWRPLYVGQASSFKERLPNHERLDEARRLGATHIHAKVVREKSLRDKWERLLIQSLNPRLNVQHRGLLVNNLLSH